MKYIFFLSMLAKPTHCAHLIEHNLSFGFTSILSLKRVPFARIPLY